MVKVEGKEYRRCLVSDPDSLRRCMGEGRGASQLRGWGIVGKGRG